MNLDARMMVPIFEANEDFSRVIHLAESYGRVVIFKNNKPKYLMIDLEQETLIYDLTEEERAVYEVDSHEVGILESVDIEEIFQVANECFENPGSLFADTGCAHSCALVHKGQVLCQMEDIGRYNALDKGSNGVRGRA